jgi:hypothetical protein
MYICMYLYKILIYDYDLHVEILTVFLYGLNIGFAIVELFTMYSQSVILDHEKFVRFLLRDL